MRPVGPIRLMPMAAHPPRVATAADLARIAQFNRTETPFPDNVTLQALIDELGRASCRERAENWGGAGASSARRQRQEYDEVRSAQDADARATTAPQGSNLRR